MPDGQADITSQFLEGVGHYEAHVDAVAVTFSAPAFAGEEQKDKDKKNEKKGGHANTFGDKKEEKKDEKKGK